MPSRKDNSSDLDDHRRLNSPADQREDNVTATGTTDRWAGAISLPVPVMAAPSVWEKSLQEFIKQGPTCILREIQRGLSSRVGDLERKRRSSFLCDKNISNKTESVMK